MRSPARREQTGELVEQQGKILKLRTGAGLARPRGQVELFPAGGLAGLPSAQAAKLRRKLG